jgi:DNA segregation ATPase FtsK/SpoIIIE, S-DNA-T family
MSEYKKMTEEELANINSQFLINSWSFSKVACFSRHEKAFEAQYIYNYDIKSSATTIAGVAYHNALQFYFQSLKEGNILDLADLEAVAFDTIDETPANKWKIQKTVPTVAECKIKANKTVTALLKFFIKEVGVYTDEIEEVLDVEVYGSEYLTINGVDIPLACNFKIDLVVKLKNGKIAVIDHKSKSVFSSEEEMKLFIGRQAITYAKGYESKTSIAIDEVWFVENKYSENRDKSNQLNCFKIELDPDNRKLYEALLYEPLKRMLEAVNDPDYVYMINDSDNLIDSAEIYEFWAKTLIAEVEDFNVDESKKEMISKRLRKIRDASMGSINPKVIKQFKENASAFIQYDLSNKNMTDEEKIEHVLRTFGSPVKVDHKFNGYSSNTYLLAVSGGVKIASIQSHKLDLASALNVSNVRVSKDLVVYEGKSYLAVEISKKRERDLLFTKKDLVDMKIPIGRDNFEQVIYWDLNNHSTPHALFCGATGSGKSVSLKSTIEFAKLAKVKHIIILDPKFEFCRMGLKGVQIISEIEDIEIALGELVIEMNERVKSGSEEKTLIIFDEFADAQSQGRKGKELDIMEMVEVGQQKMKGMFGDTLVPKMKLQKTGTKNTLEENLRILAQKGRSVGFRIAAATQRASVKIISGDAKANFPVQICFRVPKEIDSKVVLDEGGAESLAGAGDGLIRSPEYPELVRFQAYFKG